MEAFGLILGHLFGDYIVQRDYMAKNKSNPHPGKEPHPGKTWMGYGPAPKQEYPGPWSVDASPCDRDGFKDALEERNRKIDEWDAKEEARINAYLESMNSPELVEQRAWCKAKDAWWTGHWACLLHCLCYTLAVWAFSFWWMPWWGLLVCFLVHFPIDRWKLAAWWMTTRLVGQSEFASPKHPLFPWSIVVVDNTFHLFTLFVIAVIHQYVSRGS